MNPTQPIVSVMSAARRAAADPLHLPAKAAHETVATFGGAVSWAASQLGQHVDLTPLVKQLVDLDSLIGDVGLAAVLDRVDLVRIVESVIAEIDLPEIIRESTGSVASSTLRGVRMQGISADEAVARVVDRLRPRNHRTPPSAPMAASER